MSFRLAFHYSPGSSRLHGWDPRCKLAALLVASYCMLSMERPALLLFTLLLIFLLPAAGLSARRTLGELRVFLGLFALIFLSQGLLRDGAPLLNGLPISRVGAISAALTCWRLVLVMGFGMVFLGVTRRQEVALAMQWFLELLHLPGATLSFMASLAVRFIPEIMDAADEVRAAGRARAADRGGWLRRSRAFFLPLIRSTLLRSEDLSLALSARCWASGQQRRLPAAPLLHVAAFLLFAATAIASQFLEFLS